MELISVLKIIFNHFKKSYFIFTGIWFTIGLLLFIPMNQDDEFFAIILLIYMISSIIFTIVLGSILYGSYGKTLACLQNNRKNYVLGVIIVGIANSLLFTLVTAFIRLNSKAFYFNPFTFEIGITMFSFYISVFYLSGLYGLFISQKKKFRKIFYIIFTFIILTLGLFFIPISLELIVNLIEFNRNYDYVTINLSFNIFNIIAIALTSVYYLNLNIVKAYSNNN